MKKKNGSIFSKVTIHEIRQNSVFLRVDNQEDRLIKEYAKANNISVSALFKTTVLEKN